MHEERKQLWVVVRAYMLQPSVCVSLCVVYDNIIKERETPQKWFLITT